MCSEQIKAVMEFLGSAITSLAIALIGWRYTTKMGKAELNVKYIELATKLLDHQNFKVKNWAVDVINRHSEIQMPGEVKAAIVGSMRTSESGSDSAFGSGTVG